MTSVEELTLASAITDVLDKHPELDDQYKLADLVWKEFEGHPDELRHAFVVMASTWVSTEFRRRRAAATREFNRAAREKAEETTEEKPSGGHRRSVLGRPKGKVPKSPTLNLKRTAWQKLCEQRMSLGHRKGTKRFGEFTLTDLTDVIEMRRAHAAATLHGADELQRVAEAMTTAKVTVVHDLPESVVATLDLDSLSES